MSNQQQIKGGVLDPVRQKMMKRYEEVMGFPSFPPLKKMKPKEKSNVAN